MKLHNIVSLCLSLFAGVALLTACDNETDFADPNNRDGKPLRIETSIAETRAVVKGTNFAEGDHIGLFVLDGDGKSYTENSMNQQVTYSNNTWVMQNDIVLSGNLSPYIYAFYPHFDVGDYITGPKDVKIPINLTPNLYNDVSGQADWMYANILLTQGNTAKLTFRHALARVTLQLKRGTEEQGDGFLSLVRMQNATKYNASTNEVMGKGKKLQTYGIMSLSDGTIETYGEENANIELGTELVLSEDAQSIDILVIPTAPNGQLCTPEEGTTGGGIEVLFTIDGKQYRVDLGIPTWHAGQQYIYPITINRNSAEVTPELTPTEGEYVDLGLPSGTLWASCNVGANSPEEAGGYYAWGETDEKENYSWDTYNWGTETSLIKYCTSSDYGTVDNKVTLDLEDDVAHVKLGSDWRMPTTTELKELLDNCTWTSGTYNNVNGYFVSGDNGNRIFIPIAGYKSANTIKSPDSYGAYWSSTLDEKYSNSANGLRLYEDLDKNASRFRQFGCPVRPIYDPQPTEEAGEAIDLGLSVKWASFNVGATKPEEYGGYYAWGETEEKEEYSWGTYNWCKGTATSIFKYCTNSSYGTVDNKTTLDLEDDVAHVKWGGTWRMPTQAECQELLEKCTWTWTETGYIVSASNGNSIFLPNAGLYGHGPRGYYWSATLDEYYGGDCAYYLLSSEGDKNWYRASRYCGQSVRPVTE